MSNPFKDAAKALIRQAALKYKLQVKTVMKVFRAATQSPGPSRHNFTSLMTMCSKSGPDLEAEQEMYRSYIRNCVDAEEPIEMDQAWGPDSQIEISKLEFLFNVIDIFFYQPPRDFEYEMYPKISDLFGVSAERSKPKVKAKLRSPKVHAAALAKVPDDASLIGLADVENGFGDAEYAIDDRGNYLSIDAFDAANGVYVDVESVEDESVPFDNENGADDADGPESLSDIAGRAGIVDHAGREFGTPAPKLILPERQVIPWNTEQQKAFTSIFKWLRTPAKRRSQIYRMFGYAGVGKTAMARHIADFVYEEAGKNGVGTGGVIFAAYTGKACSVLRSKGCLNAQTLHSLIYRPVIDPATGMCTGFTLNHESPLAECALLVIDEASMVPDDMAQDILAFGCAILVLGDPAQLPPVKGEGYFILAEPDTMLTEISRQAKDSPIIYLATRAREGKTIKPGKYGDSRVYDYGKHISDEMYERHDQVICGLNSTRQSINKRSRRINGKAERNPVYPVAGDRLMCLRNNREAGLYNGTMWTASKPKMGKILQPIFKGATRLKEGRGDVLQFKIRSLDESDSQGNPIILKTQVSPHHFNTDLREPPWRDIQGSDAFDFAYGITVHKGQGSQFKSVLIFDESQTFREHAKEHRYTGYSRAEEVLTICL